ncbi:MAG: hypothetical protein ABW022_15695 [Actinoplanes sp.]
MAQMTGQELVDQLRADKDALENIRERWDKIERQQIRNGVLKLVGEGPSDLLDEALGVLATFNRETAATISAALRALDQTDILIKAAGLGNRVVKR